MNCLGASLKPAGISVSLAKPSINGEPDTKTTVTPACAIGHAVMVTNCGRICIGKRKINLSQVFSGQLLGIREVDEKIWLVSFLDFDLGYFDEVEGGVEPGTNPFAAKVLTIPPV